MPRCRVDTSIERREIGGFAFPLGVYPIEDMKPREGFVVLFEPADGGDGEEEWEEWPDRYVFDIAISATRVEALARALFAMLPGRIYPILDFLGHDAFREIDPYVAYDLIGQERFIDALRRYRGFFFEDGLVGFGVLSEQPFMYVFVDEHKLVTVRVEAPLKEKVEALLHAFDLGQVDEIAGADAVAHEHRGVLDAPDERTDLYNQDEIVEELVDDWGLVLNVDINKNLDPDGADLGITGWRVLVRWDRRPDTAEEAQTPAESAASSAQGSDDPADQDAAEPDGTDEPYERGELRHRPIRPRKTIGKPDPAGPDRRYAELLITASCLAEADVLAVSHVRELLDADAAPDGTETVITADRLTTEGFATAAADTTWQMQPKGKSRAVKPVHLPVDMSLERVILARWL